MSDNESCCSPSRVLAWTIGILGSTLVVGGLVWLMIAYTRPAPLGEDRVALRKKNLAELRAAEKAALEGPYAYVDKAKGIVRLPVSRAVELTLKDWSNPAAARADLIARIEKATAKPPEVKSAFE